ncbi:DUF309 domain-containing protein [Staphylococcus warneri]|uniref:DUF309 domain-containing protein n=1 Tax=Staphylococcus warneri TaxID=1292 RepID=A0A364UTA2_STAWA|nr:MULTISPECIES: DUF309 domain-containing protein [Staphylococcus]MBJ7883574.1 DUF309 domain-containing protein [Bacillaceae bacterium HSR45]PAK74050.1 hypothetical protein B8W95_02735 [Staphylococcus pasteuri]POO68873.1 DUF309 domain-containing protein [Bacillus amyloliquefaciens]COS73232.1 Domain of uncharacterised function (DUF309) [Streptococcus pneumoniae]AGC90563.1 hypothetical protein A284_06230 [Staphylococcus warneri SG1]
MEQALIQFYYHFHTSQHYFLCHDILEEAWKENNHFSKQDAVVSLILCATACYHFRRCNLKGAAKSFDKAKQVIKNANKEDQMQLHLNIQRYITLLDQQMTRVAQRQPFEPIQLPINVDMLNRIQLHYSDYHFVSSPILNDEIVHHHLLRDRSDVILARQLALKDKQYQRLQIDNNKNQ